MVEGYGRITRPPNNRPFGFAHTQRWPTTLVCTHVGAKLLMFQMFGEPRAKLLRVIIGKVPSSIAI